MKKYSLLILSSFILSTPIALISCQNPSRTYWTNLKFDEIFTNATYDEEGTGEELEVGGKKAKGSFNNNYGASKEEILEMFKDFKFELTAEGKKMTALEMYEHLRDAVSEYVLPQGKYYGMGDRKTFEQVFGTNPIITNLLICSFPNFNKSKFPENKFEFRYSIYKPKDKENLLVISSQFFYSDKNHIDSQIVDVTMKHDTGVGIGPIFFYTISGFKEV
ncbi:hypothetical protein JN00_0027 [Metamycoplasma subdolum]|uniref:Lipoprotein n=1 Tax=Metamycoplasma subdolum TaxID=92407 RepID=A0A3M0A1Y1_9BACT|nr:hypothetical protein [Metamycoplasma subdolum]RMA78983.1 hypothetical protein JN00_0027 [Metamycoplasma subdolum]WPB50506.1 hypothetical protein R9C05_02765 [Metamycoplasma subdolum]